MSSCTQTYYSSWKNITILVCTKTIKYNLWFKNLNHITLTLVISIIKKDDSIWLNLSRIGIKIHTHLLRSTCAVCKPHFELMYLGLQVYDYCSYQVLSTCKLMSNEESICFREICNIYETFGALNFWQRLQFYIHI